MFENVQTVHLIGIGGIGVSAVARLLASRGFSVQGSDVRESSLTEALRTEGIDVRIGHGAERVDGADLVVRSTAISEDNVEIRAAQESGIPVVHRSEVLNELTRDHTTIGVTGTHGKGTVSSMIAWILECAGWDPGFFIGGMLENFGTNARDTDGKYFVLEVDESDGTHCAFELDFVVCNFLELDHLNYYDGLDHIIGTMRDFLVANQRRKDVFVNLDCAGNRRLCEALPFRPTGYSVDHGTEFRGVLLSDGQLPLQFAVEHRGDRIGEFELPLPGYYNVLNASAAISVAVRLGVPTDAIAEAMRTYRGLENRFTIVRGGGRTIVKDYVSHPTGMEKVLESARSFTTGRLISVFKPYRYTLIKYLGDEYARALRESDQVVITTMYAADEEPIPGVDTRYLVDKLEQNELAVAFIANDGDIPEFLIETAEPNDTIVFFGGDDFFRMADELVADFARRGERGEAGPPQRAMGGPLDAGSSSDR